MTATNESPASAPGQTPAMRAAMRERYGPPRVIQLREIPKPEPGEGQVLVRVAAAGVNPYDFHMLRGSPVVVRAIAGWLKPKQKVLGIDFAGTVEAVGPGVEGMAPGDEVFGSGPGAFADYTVVNTSKLASRPEHFSFEEAAGIPVAGLTALQGLRDKGGLKAGQRVLVNGASGGVGMSAVQIAKAYGAEVTGVCSTRNLELVTSLGADHIIDYTKEDFTRSSSRYDIVLDAVGNRSLGDCKRIVAPDGMFVAAAGSIRRTIWMAIKRDKQAVSMLANVNRDDLMELKQLAEDGKFSIVIDRRYPLDKVPDAIAYVEEGHARGKVIVTM